MSEHYRVFEQFYIIRSQRISDSLFEQVRQDAISYVSGKIGELTEDSIKTLIEREWEKSDSFLKAKTDIAIENLKNRFDETEKNIEKTLTNAESKAIEATQNAVDKEIGKVTSKLSETSVTILSIFAGIVLTIVAGLFYSSSVIENIKDTNIFKLICVSSLVGLVCFGLISIMFYYIDKFRTGNDTKTKLPIITKVISGILLLLIVLFLILYFFVPDKYATNDSNKSDVNISANVNLSEVTTTATTTVTTEITTAMQQTTSDALLDSAT